MWKPFLKVSFIALIFAACLPCTGCHMNQETRLKVIQRETDEAVARADERLDQELDACGDDVDCRHAALGRHAATMREIQAKHDARIDAELERSRGR